MDWADAELTASDLGLTAYEATHCVALHNS